jgi:protein-disulfide isomerase
MKQKTILIVTAVVLLAVFAIGSFAYKNYKNEQATATAASNMSALARPHSPSFGDAAAPVHIVEFLDPACETCRQFYPLVKKMMADNPGKIKVTLRYTPFHPGSDQVVKMLEAARRQAKLRQAIEALFQNQNAWVINHTAHADLAWRYLEGLDLDMNRIRSDMELPEIAQAIQQDLADAKTLNVTKTPEFFVNGKPLPSFGYEQLKTLVDEALAAAK